MGGNHLPGSLADCGCLTRPHKDGARIIGLSKRGRSAYGRILKLFVSGPFFTSSQPAQACRFSREAWPKGCEDANCAALSWAVGNSIRKHEKHGCARHVAEAAQDIVARFECTGF